MPDHAVTLARVGGAARPASLTKELPMTVIPANALSPFELNQLGHNLAAEVRRDQRDVDAMNRSLATLGEELDDEAVEAACRSEHVAS